MLIDLKSLDLVKVPRENSNDSHPVWMGDTIYVLSDRNGPVSLFAYDTKSKAVTELAHNQGYDLKSPRGARACPARTGHDVQLEKAVQVVLDQLKDHPVPEIPIPAAPNFHPNDGLGVQ